MKRRFFSRNWIIGCSVFLLFVIFIFPFTTGFYIEKLLEKGKGELSQFVRFTSLSHKRGFFSTQIQGDATEIGGLKIPFLLEGSISHFSGNGFFIIKKNGEKNASVMGGDSSLWRYLQQISDIELNVSPSLIRKGLGVEFFIESLRSISLGANQWGIQAEGTKGRLHWNIDENNGGKIDLIELKLGSMSMKESLIIKKLLEPGFILKFERDPLLTSGSLEIFFDRYQCEENSHSIGPGLFQIKLSRVDTKALDQIYEKLAKLKAEFLTLKKMPDNVKMQMAMEVMGMLTQLTRHSPELELTEFKIKTQDGDLMSSARLAFKQGSMGFNLFSLFSQIIFQLEAQTPKSMIESVFGSYKEKINSFIKEKYIVLDGERMKVSLKFNDGKFLINDKPLQLKP